MSRQWAYLQGLPLSALPTSVALILIGDADLSWFGDVAVGVVVYAICCVCFYRLCIALSSRSYVRAEVIEGELVRVVVRNRIRRIVVDRVPTELLNDEVVFGARDVTGVSLEAVVRAQISPALRWLTLLRDYTSIACDSEELLDEIRLANSTVKPD